MNLVEELDSLVKENMSEEGYKFWNKLIKSIPKIWNKPSSSTGKYHLTEDGSVQTIVEHTYEMVFACCKTMKLFEVKPNTQEADVLILGILLHDTLKYGRDIPLLKHTDKKHDQAAANAINRSRKFFETILTENQVTQLENIVRYHSGIWSTDIRGNTDFSLKKLSPESFYVHILDMLSTNGCLRKCLPKQPIEAKDRKDIDNSIMDLVVALNGG